MNQVVPLTIQVPAAVDASGLGLFEMRATIHLVPSTQFPNDTPEVQDISVLLPQDHCDLPTQTCFTVTGTQFPTTIVPPGPHEIWRQWNGDLCVVPGTEKARSMGYVEPTNGVDTYLYGGRFGGDFYEADGTTRTTANFSGRWIHEELTNGPNSCFANAHANGFLPENEGCPSALLPPFSWQVTATDGSRWGACSSMTPALLSDTIAMPTDCIDQYLHYWSAAMPSCEWDVQQTMSMSCRDPSWGWSVEYWSTHGAAFELFDDGVLPESTQARRGDSALNRTWFGSTRDAGHPPVCSSW